METKLLAACIQSRKAYEIIKANEAGILFSPISAEIFKDLICYYDNDSDVDNIDLQIIENRFKKLPGKRGQPFLAVLQNLPEVSVENVVRYVLENCRDKLKTRMAIAISTNHDDELTNCMNQYLALDIKTVETSKGYEVFNGASIKDIVLENKTQNLIKVLPMSLNAVLGGGLPKNSSTNMLIFASPEVGKTLFAVNMAYGFCRQGLKVVYIGNEEDHKRLLLRFVARFATFKEDRWDKLRVLGEPDKAEELANKYGYKALTFIPLAPGTMYDVEKIINEHQPEAIFLDQIRNFSYPRLGQGLEQLTKVSYDIRCLGKKYNLITVGLCQSGDPGKLVLERSDVYGSRINVSGDQDVQIGLGMDLAMERNDRRMVSVCKNKLSGDHSYFLVGLDRGSNRVQSL